MILAFSEFAKLKESTKSKRLMLTSFRRELLLVYGAMVFADTRENVDERSPRFFCITQTRHLFSTSTLNAQVYTDESQDVGGALTKENHSIWDDEW